METAVSLNIAPNIARRPPGVGLCLALSIGAALAGLGLRFAVVPTAPADGAAAARRHYERIRPVLPPDKVRQNDEIWRRLDRL